MSETAGLDCLQIVAPYIQAVTAEGMPPVQLMGGVGSAALRHPDTVIEVEAQRIIAPNGLRLRQYRDDGNLRDVETLVLSSNPKDIAVVETCLAETVGDQLVREVFGYRNAARAAELRAAPFGVSALKTFLSDRYGSTNNPRVERILFPFQTEIVPEALATWTLEIDNLEVPVPAPGAVILNYLTRSISGLRAKDAEKVYEMADRVFTEAPELLEWIQDGPGKNQFVMARILHRLRSSSQGRSLVLADSLTISPMATDLAEHEQFMLWDATDLVKRRSLQLAAIKSRGLGRAESFDWAVTFFQRYLEPHFHSVVHNS